MNTVLAAVDFSENSVAALDWAQTIAQSHDARLVLCHVVAPMPPAAAAPEFVALPPSAYEAQENQAREQLEELARQRREDGQQVDTRLQVGPASETVISIADSEKADLVVVGTRGLTGLKRTFLGSVAARIIREARCPVFAVPSHENGKHRPIHRLLVPTDFSADAKLAVDAALRLLGPVSAEMKLTLLHVWRVPVIFSPWSTFPMEDLRRSAAADARRRLEEAAAPLRAEGYEVETKECDGEPADEIDRVAADVGADVIAMGTHGRSGLSRVFLGSVAERTLPSAPCPVLTVHSEDSGGS